MLNSIIPGRSYYQYYIKSRFERNVICAHIAISGTHEPAALAVVDRIDWIGEISRACLYLDKTDGVIFRRYKINLYTGHPDVLARHGIALYKQILACYPLSPLAKFIMSGHLIILFEDV